MAGSPAEGAGRPFLSNGAWRPQRRGRSELTLRTRCTAILGATMKRRPGPDALFAARPSRKTIPFDFVIAEIEELGPFTRPMFGCHAVYVDDKIIFLLRD